MRPGRGLCERRGVGELWRVGSGMLAVGGWEGVLTFGGLV
jgi:hypothetical protein